MSTSLPDNLSEGSTPIEFKIQGQIVLILCGLIASGKSTFAEALQHYYPEFRRCNQDDLGDRRSVEQLARKTLREGHSVCIDRTNFNAAQRSYWIQIAHEFPETVVWVIVFDTPYEICAARLQMRSSHPTIKTPEQGLSVLSRFAADFRQPVGDEGYQRILYVKPSDHPSSVYSRSDIAVILQRVQDSPSVFSNEDQKYAKSRFSFRGNTNKGPSRGGWVDPLHQSPRAPRGRSTNANAGASNYFRHWQSGPYRGNSVGLHSARGILSRYSGTLQSEDNSSEAARQDDGPVQEDPFVID